MHSVRFYDDGSFPAEALAGFLWEGLQAGEGAAIVASTEHAAAVSQALMMRGADIAQLKNAHQFLNLNAAEMLQQFSRDDSLDADRFVKSVGKPIERIIRASGNIRIFAEMVVLLMVAGKFAAAVKLENLWNEFLSRHRAQLYCAYPMQLFRSLEHTELFARLIAAHDHVVPLHDWGSEETQYGRRLAQLQQLTIALIAEVAQRTQAEQGALAGEALLQNVFDNAAIGVVIADTAGRFMRVNSAFSALLGYPDQNLLATTIFSHTHPDDADKERALHAALVSGERRVYILEKRCLRGDGSPICVRETASYIPPSDRRPPTVIRIVEDINERHRADDFLRYQAQLANTVQDAIVATDTQFRITAWNRGAVKTYGWEEDEARGRLAAELFATEFTNTSREQAIEQLKRDGHFSAEVLQKRKDGSKVAIESTARAVRNAEGDVTGYVAINRDITKRLAAERQLRYHAQLLNSVQDAVIATDSRFVITAWNPAAETLYGYTAEEAVGQLSYRLVRQALTHEDITLAEKLLIENGSARGEAVHFDRNGQRLTVEVSVRVVRDHADAPIGLVAVVRDISERKRIEAELQHSHQQMRQFAARLQASRENERLNMAREIHDELGQALTALKMDVAILQNSLESLNGPAAATQKMSDMTNLIDHTIRTVRRIATDLRPSILDELGLVAAIEWYVQEFQNRTTIRVTLETELENLDLDPDKTTAAFRILQEALTNAARHSKADTILIELKLDDSGQVLLQIRDNGIGFDTRPAMDNNKSLGLLGMKERANLSGSTLTVHSKRGEGTVVTLRMPLTASSPVHNKT